MLWGLNAEICSNSPLGCRAESKACTGCVQICASINHQLPPAEHSLGSVATLWMLMATRQGRLRQKVEENYLGWNIWSCSNSFRWIPAKHVPPPALQAELSPTKFTSPSYHKLFPSPGQNHAFHKLSSERPALKMTFINLCVVDEERRN